MLTGMSLSVALVIVAALYVVTLGGLVRARSARYDGLNDVPGPYDGTIRITSELPRPRPIRVTFKAKLQAFMAFPGPIILFAVIANDERHRATPGITMGGLSIFFGLLEVILVGSIWLRPFIRDKYLTSNGDVAIGRILKILATRGYPYALYGFDTPSGKQIRKMDMTCRSDLTPGMKVPVFYDRENPKKAVALCSSFYDVVLPLEQ
jgi:hypothetical protein